MAVPSRAFVGIFVFALIASLAIIPYTLLVLTGYEAPPDAPHEAFFPEEQDSSVGTKMVLVIASVFCVVLVVAAWRGLLHGARMDRKVRLERATRPKEPERRLDEPAQPNAKPKVEEQPPGYQ